MAIKKEADLLKPPSLTDLPSILCGWRGLATQAQATAALGVSLRTYQAWEQGRKMDASMQSLLMLVIRFVKPAMPA